MSYILRGNARMAMASLKSTKWRSSLMILGIVVAVVPVILILGIGEGVKRQVRDEVTTLGSDTLTIRPGNISETNTGGVLGQLSSLGGYSTSGAFTTRDVEAVRNASGLSAVAPISVVPGAIEVEDKMHTQPFVVGTTQNFPELINRSVQHGEFFSEAEYHRRVAVVGRGAAEKIFGDGIPLGRAFDFHGQMFIVRGVLERFETPPLSFNADFNNAIMIPSVIAEDLSGAVAVNEILARPAEGAGSLSAANAVEDALRESRGGSEDFSVLTQAENLRTANRILTTITSFVTAVAAIALLVSGIGIMNIMLVSVTERMHEIGVRKAIGATKRQVMEQFMAEAALLSLAGAIVGVLAALVCDYFIRLLTDIQPVITWQAAVLVTGVTVLVGIFFGTFPAFKAAQKDPISALRHE